VVLVVELGQGANAVAGSGKRAAAKLRGNHDNIQTVGHQQAKRRHGVPMGVVKQRRDEEGMQEMEGEMENTRYLDAMYAANGECGILGMLGWEEKDKEGKGQEVWA
jgi:hypothetical protein